MGPSCRLPASSPSRVTFIALYRRSRRSRVYGLINHQGCVQYDSVCRLVTNGHCVGCVCLLCCFRALLRVSYLLRGHGVLLFLLLSSVVDYYLFTLSVSSVSCTTLRPSVITCGSALAPLLLSTQRCRMWTLPEPRPSSSREAHGCARGRVLALLSVLFGFYLTLFCPYVYCHGPSPVPCP